MIICDVCYRLVCAGDLTRRSIQNRDRANNSKASTSSTGLSSCRPKGADLTSLPYKHGDGLLAIEADLDDVQRIAEVLARLLPEEEIRRQVPDMKVNCRRRGGHE